MDKKLIKYRDLYLLLEATKKLNKYLELFKNKKNLTSKEFIEFYTCHDVYYILIITALDNSLYNFIRYRTRYLRKTSNLKKIKEDKARIFFSTLINIIKENPNLWSSGEENDIERRALLRVERIQKKYRNKFIHPTAKGKKEYSWLRRKKYPLNVWEARETFKHVFLILEDLYRKNKTYCNHLKEIKSHLRN